MEKYEFCSKEWLEEARRQLQEGMAGEDLTGIEFTVCEEFTNAPEHLLSGSRGKVGWTIRISGGEVELLDCSVPEADVSAVRDYNGILADARRVRGAVADPELKKQLDELVATQTAKKFPEALLNAGWHDRMAVRTA